MKLTVFTSFADQMTEDAGIIYKTPKIAFRILDKFWRLDLVRLPPGDSSGAFAPEFFRED